jgi:hypothetical protein
MIEIMEKTLRFLGGKGFLKLLVLTFACYILVDKAGLFRLETPPYREIFFSIPSRILSILFVINAIAGLILVFSDKGKNKKSGYVLFFVSIIIMAAGLWISVYTRFEGRMIRAEGQTFDSFAANYIPQTLYNPNPDSLPNLSITIMKLAPEPSADMQKMKKVTADVIYAGKTLSGKILKPKLSSEWPFISDWMFIRITDFGYAPKYVLYDADEKELESHYVFYKLFPPGAEDHFETMFLGYLFYVQCYPDYVEKDGKPWTLSAYPKNPVFNLRIVRNKDIVYNGLLRPSEKVRFDNVIIGIPEVRMWVEISIVRDPGVFVAGAGLILLITATGFLMARRR